MFDGHFVTVCPPGIAESAFYLRDRGRTDIRAEITCWPTEEHRGKLTTTHWRSIDDRISVEDQMIQRIEKPTESDRIRMRWLGRQVWAALDADKHATRILAWFVDPSKAKPTRYYPKRSKP